MFDDASSQGARIIMRSVAEGLRENGYDAHVFELNHRDPTVCERMKADVLAYQPDLIFLANHPVQHLLNQIGLAAIDCNVIVWLFDDPSIMGDDAFQPHEIVLAADPSFIAGAIQRGAEKIHFVPVAAPCTYQTEVKEEYRYPVVYAGSIFVNHAMRDSIQPGLQPVVRELIQQKLRKPELKFQALLSSHEIKKLLNIPVNSNFQITLNKSILYFMYAECNRHWRLQFVKALEPTGLHLFGNKAWLPYIQNTPLQQRFHAPIDSFTQYPHLIRSADINININSLQGITAPTLRDFQIPYYGGFQVTASFQPHPQSWQEHDPKNVFELEDFPWSDTAASPLALHELVMMYLDKPQQRSEWVSYTNNVITQKHTMAHRIGQIQELLSNLLE